MSNIFPKWMNAIPTAGAIGSVGLLGVTVWAGWYYLTPDFFEVGYAPDQPVDYSHQIHAGKLGMDCRYCHTHVEDSRYSNVPDTATCMNCHTGALGDMPDDPGSGYLTQQLWNRHAFNKDLMLVREAFATSQPIRWRRVHKLPDYAHFNHAAHVDSGVSCYSCHGRVDRQTIVRQVEGLGMGWCLECHRNPGAALVDVDGILPGDQPVRITDLGEVERLLGQPEQKERGAALVERKKIVPPQDCSACHY